ncbi:MAG: hypothetical protein ABFQ65_00060 [Nanoarchaeota archaeon]
MGKLFDYCMTGDWEETQRIALYKKLGKKLDDLSPEQLKKIKKIMNE